MSTDGRGDTRCTGGEVNTTAGPKEPFCEPSCESDTSEYPNVCLDGRGIIAGFPNKGWTFAGKDTIGVSVAGGGAEAAIYDCSGAVDDSFAVAILSLASASDKNDDGAGARGVREENTELEEREASAAKIDSACRVDESFGSLGLNWKSDDKPGGVGVGGDKGAVASLIDLFGNEASFLRSPFVAAAGA